MAKTYGNFTDFIDFSRASSGTALRKVSYGPELVTNGTFDSDLTGWTVSAGEWSWSGGKAVINSTVYSVLTQAIPAKSGVVAVSITISEENGSGGLIIAAKDFGGNYRELKRTNSNATGAVRVETINVNVVGISDVQVWRQNPSVAANGSIDNISVKEVTFDQADGTLELFNHPDDIPRVEYDSNGVLKGLLIEEQRTNLVTYSVYSAAYSDTAVTVTSGSAPDGSSDGAILTEDTLTSLHRTRTPILNVTLSSPAVASVYIKNISGSRNVYLNTNAIMGTAVNINPSTGAINSTYGSPNVTVENVGNETFRVSWTGVGTGNSNGVYAQINQNTSSADESYLGDGSSAIQVWGFQLEQGSFPTSYIPTSGAQATRSADIASIATSNFGYNKKAGTLVVECLSNSGESGERAVSLSDGTSTNQNWLQISGGGSFVGNVYTSGAYVAQLDNTTSTADGFTAALAFKDNSFGASVNGNTVVTDSAGSIAVYSDLHIGRRHDGLSSTVFNGHIKSIKYLPRRNTNTQLQEFTS